MTYPNDKRNVQPSTGMKLYNVVIEVVDLVWANSEQGAMTTLSMLLQGHGFQPLGDKGDRACISEPVPEMGWDGEQ